jgi:hypothetical protein
VEYLKKKKKKRTFLRYVKEILREGYIFLCNLIVILIIKVWSWIGLVGKGFKPSDFPIQDGSLSGQGSQDLLAA